MENQTGSMLIKGEGWVIVHFWAGEYYNKFVVILSSDITHHITFNSYNDAENYANSKRRI